MLTNFPEVRQLGSDCLFISDQSGSRTYFNACAIPLLLKNKKTFHVEVHMFNCG